MEKRIQDGKEGDLKQQLQTEWFKLRDKWKRLRGAQMTKLWCNLISNGSWSYPLGVSVSLSTYQFPSLYWFKLA
jgi:glucan-binding YG repeat protein